MKIGHPLGEGSGDTYYAFTDNRAVALFLREWADERYVYGFVHEINFRDGRIIPFPSDTYVPITITKQEKLDDDYLELEARVNSSDEISDLIRAVDGEEISFKLNKF